MSESHRDFFHTGPNTLAGRFLRTFWQPVCVAETLKPGQALPVKIMSEEFTVYRGESGMLHLVSFRCAHRGAQLSTGWVEGDCIRCMYHGWKYDGDGQCIEQPGEEKFFATKVKISSYPIKEYYGLLFVYLGEGMPPPMRKFPDFEQPGLISVGPPEVWPCNYFNRVDNACDIGHVTFTHSETLKRRFNQPEYFTVPALSAEETEYGIRTAVMRPGKPADYFHFHMPNINQAPPSGRVETGMREAQNLRAHRLFWRVPIDDDHCVSYVVSWLPLTGDAAREFEEKRQSLRSTLSVSPNELGEQVLKGKLRVKEIDKDLSQYYLFWLEDYVVQVGQGAIPDRSNDRLGRMDVGVILLRKIWERELRALAEGSPLKEWKSPEKLLVESK
jgi:5,5'-dehydrodivanillate O-demethylase